MEVRIAVVVCVMMVIMTGSPESTAAAAAAATAAATAVWEGPSEDIIPDYELLALPDSEPVFDLEKKISHKKNKNKQSNSTITTAKPPSSSSNSRRCSCVYGVCTCCTGPLLDLFSQKACMKIVYSPEDFSFDMSMLLNNRLMYESKISGKNPPPACIALPPISSLKLCAKLSNIYFAGRNLHMCMGFEGKWDYYELFKIELDCVRMGNQGFAVVKPEEGGGIVTGGIAGGVDAVIDAGGDDIGDYDENVVRSVKKQNKNKNSTKSVDKL